jgi:hypothetical protein
LGRRRIRHLVGQKVVISSKFKKLELSNAVPDLTHRTHMMDGEHPRGTVGLMWISSHSYPPLLSNVAIVPTYYSRTIARKKIHSSSSTFSADVNLGRASPAMQQFFPSQPGFYLLKYIKRCVPGRSSLKSISNPILSLVLAVLFRDQTNFSKIP